MIYSAYSNRKLALSSDFQKPHSELFCQLHPRCITEDSYRHLALQQLVTGSPGDAVPIFTHQTTFLCLKSGLAEGKLPAACTGCRTHARHLHSSASAARRWGPVHTLSCRPEETFSALLSSLRISNNTAPFQGSNTTGFLF